MAPSTTAAATVQHVTKKSSDELLRKFAELGGEEESDGAKKALKRRRKGTKTGRVHENSCESPSHYYNGGGLVAERRSLLAVGASRKSALLKRVGICRSHLKASRDVKKKPLLSAIDKAWRRALEGGWRLILDNHYHPHRRLISEMV